MKIQDRLSESQKANLETLSNYLLSGELQADFSMWKYSYWGNEEIPGTYTCGSVGCAVGHGPYAGINPGSAKTWYGYCCENFVSTVSDIWHFLFSARWGSYDNTPEGAAKRIRFVLNNLEMEEEALDDLIPWKTTEPV